MRADEYESFSEIKGRLDEIVQAVGDDALPLDDALTLYEEAVALGLRVSDLLEESITEEELTEAAADGQPLPDSDGSAASQEV
ncbi:exodeoxyribonuclease VII small subunit [Xiamenia xianingshaonis]|uniref:Exodeoxyribonuclease VII small subunit n=1 Tax=Xiamenia xianingshaonis TaxID=2682776 RepID=A0A9E6MR83_9ACTN|nr:exodeoxyribonuclease VII small subunit [Xiamenia xianingshaonis]NGM17792.1 exodeoxyribonuclease VII small subunit [Eggerthellaceae bacterium zg-893]NHM13305.1 exodeoxyribonuclease VII small subunit [Xiamenia xianingshaonis]NHM15322.1 exodeoxyribonuclease VII small subunit [Xiamenia xianingshaonis]QTU84613.1 exodeoxyribonuclease VII small subunit [Xiamenia xianingshaonis]